VVTGGTIVNMTGTTSGGSPTVSLSNTTSLKPGMTVLGEGIPDGTTIQTVHTNTNTVTLSNAVLAVGLQELLTFSGLTLTSPLLLDGTITTGSQTVTGINTTGLAAGESVTGLGIPNGTTIASVDTKDPVNGQITLSNAANG